MHKPKTLLYPLLAPAAARQRPAGWPCCNNHTKQGPRAPGSTHSGGRTRSGQTLPTDTAPHTNPVPYEPALQISMWGPAGGSPRSQPPPTAPSPSRPPQPPPTGSGRGPGPAEPLPVDVAAFRATPPGMRRRRCQAPPTRGPRGGARAHSPRPQQRPALAG